MIEEYLAGCNNLIDKKKYQEAITGLKFILMTNPSSSVTYSRLACCYAGVKQWKEALTAMVNALGHGNNQYADLEQLIDIIEQSKLNSYLPIIMQLLLKTIEHNMLEFRTIPLLWQQVTLKHASLLIDAKPIFKEETSSLLQDPTFCKLLEKGPVTNYFLEDLILSSREAILEKVINHGNIQQYLPFLSALCCQVLSNDGLFTTNGQEDKYLEKLKANTPLTDEKLIILFSYSSFDDAMSLWSKYQKTLLNSPLKFTAKQLIADLDFYTQVVSHNNLGSVEQETSKIVQRFYMDNPYPKWKSVDISKTISITAKNMLVAGCGTGQQLINYAIHNPKMQITAIDLSPISLNYAKLMAKKYQLTNINFKIFDILNVAQLKQSFDYIVCTGVLHHMESPSAGLQALKQVLVPEGEMFLAFYSTAARKELAEIYSDIKLFLNTDEAGITREGIKQWRNQLAFSNKQNEIYKVADFFYLNGLYDLLLHPQQTEYSALELKQLLTDCGVTFKKMYLPKLADARLKKHFASRSRKETETETLEYWHEIERKFPNTFLGMFQFSCF
jgi:2-polyprenyl-3-methyl-5-hydroxy-6-metoxy-1,4-benzoquinol methylase